MWLRVFEPGRPAFQLRKGEEGISAFEIEAVDPPLTEGEVLESFRPGSEAIVISKENIEALGLRVAPNEGAGHLPERLRHALEIRPGPHMSRAAFKQLLKELE